MSEIFEKLKRLSDQFEKDGQEIPAEIKGWSSQIKEAKLYAHLLQFDGMKEFLKRLADDITAIDYRLSHERLLSEVERNYLYGQKDEKQAIIRFFYGKEKMLADLENKVNEELTS